MTSALAFSGTVMIGVGTTNPGGRVAGATSGSITLAEKYPNLRGTTGAIFTMQLEKDGRKSDKLRATF